MKKPRHRFVVLVALVLAAATALSTTMQGFTGTDSFGEDWTINAGPYGGFFPATILVSGSRDTNASLGCGGSLPLDGTAVVTPDYQAIILSVTAYRVYGGDANCVSSHWSGAASLGDSTFVGFVSNEGGPFGLFGLCLGAGSCSSPGPSPASAGDPSSGGVSSSRWVDTQQQ